MKTRESLKQQITKLRENLLKNAGQYQINDLNGDTAKLYLGKLSPGCITCIQGTWACIFINGLCTRQCFFCPQNRRLKQERPPMLDNVKLETAADCVDYLQKFNFKGVGFSGGEPLLVFDRLVEYISKISRRFGNKIYIWIYTNGDLITENKLLQLKRAGLNEIRFDLGARKYDFRPIKLAKKIIKNVTVETPAVPEEENQLLASLKIMQQLKINYLNLHELFFTQYNKAAFDAKKYLYKKNHGVVNSELTAFKIFKRLAADKAKMNFNYCTVAYKNRYQIKEVGLRYAPFFKKDFESITTTGLVRQIYIKGKNPDLRRLIAKDRQLSKYFFFDTNHCQLFIHPAWLKKIDLTLLQGTDLGINYFFVAPRKNQTKKISPTEKTITVNDHLQVILKRKITGRVIVKNETQKQLYRDIFLNKKQFSRLIKKSLQNSKSPTSAAANYKRLLINYTFIRKAFKNLEYV